MGTQPRARTPQARVDLVEDHDGTSPVGGVDQGFQPPGWGNPYTTTALDGLYEHRPDPGHVRKRTTERGKAHMRPELGRKRARK